MKIDPEIRREATKNNRFLPFIDRDQIIMNANFELKDLFPHRVTSMPMISKQDLESLKNQLNKKNIPVLSLSDLYSEHSIPNKPSVLFVTISDIEKHIK